MKQSREVHKSQELLLLLLISFIFIADEESIDLSSQLETSVNVGDHAFSQMQGDLDQQRLLGERPINDPLADIMVREIQHQER